MLQDPKCKLKPKNSVAWPPMDEIYIKENAVKDAFAISKILHSTLH